MRCRGPIVHSPNAWTSCAKRGMCQHLAGAMQLAGSRYTRVSIGVDGTNRWNRGYVQYAVAGPWSGPSDLASWWLFEGSEEWATVYRMQTECNFDAQIRAAQALCLPHADKVECQLLPFVRADGRARVIMARGAFFAKESLGAMICHCCGKNGQIVLQWFGGPELAMAGIEGPTRLTGVFRDIPSERCIPNYGAHGASRVAWARNGMVSVLREHGGMSVPSTAKFVQDSVNGARKAARSARPGRRGSKKANRKGQIGIKLGAAVHFVRVRLWVPLLQKVGGIIGGHQVVGRPWVDVCRDSPPKARGDHPTCCFSTTRWRPHLLYRRLTPHYS